jgi:hypothetical protein
MSNAHNRHCNHRINATLAHLQPQHRSASASLVLFAFATTRTFTAIPTCKKWLHWRRPHRPACLCLALPKARPLPKSRPLHEPRGTRPERSPRQSLPPLLPQLLLSPRSLLVPPTQSRIPRRMSQPLTTKSMPISSRHLLVTLPNSVLVMDGPARYV